MFLFCVFVVSAFASASLEHDASSPVEQPSPLALGKLTGVDALLERLQREEASAPPLPTEGGKEAEIPQHSPVVQLLKEAVLLVVDVVGILTQLFIKLGKLWLPFFTEVPLAVIDLFARTAAALEPAWMTLWKPLSAPFKFFSLPTWKTAPPVMAAVATKEESKAFVSVAVLKESFNGVSQLNKTTSWAEVETRVKQARNCESLVRSLQEMSFSVNPGICSGAAATMWKMTNFNFTLQEPYRTVLVVIVAVVLALSFSLASAGLGRQVKDEFDSESDRLTLPRIKQEEDLQA